MTKQQKYYASDKGKATQRRHQNSAKARETRKAWRIANKPRLAGWARKFREKLRREAITQYGGQCQCCGESNEVFLVIDHINGGGCKHRREIGAKCGTDYYRWLKKNNWPKGFETLCHNCNWAKHQLGQCPHRTCKSN